MTGEELRSVPQLNALRQCAAEALRPDPDLDLVAWAEQHYVLDSSTSARTGPFRVAYTPYMALPMRLLSPHETRIERVVCKWGAQLGKTTIGLAWTGYNLHQSPSPMLVVMPTVDIAKDHSRTRIDTMIENSPALKERVPPQRSRDGGNAVLRKQAPGAALMLTGANAPAALASRPIRRLILDEVDRYPFDSGGEGSPIALAVQRTASFFNRKIFICSTPTVQDASRVQEEWEASDQRRYYVPCPRCSVYDWLRWENIQWEPGRARQTAHYVCPHCKGKVQNYEKSTMLAQGYWKAEVEGYDGIVAGFHLSSLYSPVGQLTWGDLAHEFVEAKKDPTKLQTFINTKLAELWRAQDGETLDKDAISARAEPFSWQRVAPAQVVVVVAGVDIQADRIEVEFVGVGAGEETWSLDYQVLEGDTTGPEVWESLGHALERRWSHETADIELPVALACIDANYRQDAVLAFVQRRTRTLAVIGRSGDRPIWPRASDTRSRARRRSKRSKGLIYIVGVDAAKERLFGLLAIGQAGAGYCHFPAGRADSWWSGLVSEYRKISYRAGQKIVTWHKLDGIERNEPLDCRIYAMAALYSLLANGLDLERSAERLRGRLRPTPLELQQQARGTLAPLIVNKPTVPAPIVNGPAAAAALPASASPPSRHARRIAAAKAKLRF